MLHPLPFIYKKTEFLCVLNRVSIEAQISSNKMYKESSRTTLERWTGKKIDNLFAMILVPKDFEIRYIAPKEEQRPSTRGRSIPEALSSSSTQVLVRNRSQTNSLDAYTLMPFKFSTPFLDKVQNVLWIQYLKIALLENLIVYLYPLLVRNLTF